MYAAGYHCVIPQGGDTATDFCALVTFLAQRDEAVAERDEPSVSLTVTKPQCVPHRVADAFDLDEEPVMSIR